MRHQSIFQIKNVTGVMISSHEINKELRELWLDQSNSETGKEFLKYWPLQYPDFKENALVFVGLNPSLKEPHLTENAKSKPEGDSELFSYAKQEVVLNVDSEDDKSAYSNLRRIEHIAYFGDRDSKNGKERHPYRYYIIMNRIANILNLDWMPLDLFAVRRTSQSSSLKGLTNNKGSEHHFTEFAEKQLKIFWEALIKVRPKCIVVVNAMASRIILNCRSEYHIDNSLEIAFDSSRFFHFIEIKGEKVPIFFSGSISGQGTADNFSITRLLWHIKYVLNSGVKYKSTCEELKELGLK